MIFDTNVRLGYWFVSHIGHCGPQSVTDFYLLQFERVSRPKVRQILLPLVTAGVLVKERGQGKKYDLARPANQIVLFEIYKALNPDWNQETLSVAVLVEKIFGQLNVLDLLKFDETELPNIMMRIRL